MGAPYGAGWRRLRARVLREEPVCVGFPIGVHGALRVRTTAVDHIVGISRGGTDARSNLRGLCRSCNSAKAVAVEGARAHGQGWRVR